MRTLGWLISIIVVIIIAYFIYIAYAVSSFVGECGLDDGPFKATLIEPITNSKTAQRFDLADSHILIVENRTDSLSPIITLIKNDKTIWTLDMDTSKTEGYETTEIWNISNVNITKDSDQIELNFLSFWTSGYEAGWMEIDRDSGENKFCLSW